MGTWGSSHLANDAAMDEVGMRSDELAERIWRSLGQATSWEADEHEHAVLFVDLETLFALHGAGLFSIYSLRKWEDVDGRLAAWMKGWEAYFPQLGPSEAFLAERRAVIQNSFTRLAALVGEAKSR